MASFRKRSGCLVIPLIWLAAGWSNAATAPSAGENLARGKICHYDPPPSYDFCTDAGDEAQLTDGKYNGCTWTDAGTVGWNTVKDRAAVIDIDLGEPAPIGEITFDTIGGAAGVTFPSAVLVFVSNDGQQYRYLCDVMTESLPQTQANNHRFAADALRGWGRYVRIVPLSGGFFMFCDEIEILRGTHSEQDARYASEKSIPASEVLAFAENLRSWANQKNASLTLLRQAEAALTARTPWLEDAQLVSEARQRIERARAQTMSDLNVTNIDYRQGPPYRQPEADAFKMMGQLSSRVWPDHPFVVWSKDPWERLGPLESPPTRAAAADGKASVRAEMMNNEWAIGSFVVSSASDEPQTLSLSADNFEGPGGKTFAADELLRIAQVIHVEAYGFNYPDDAIVPLAEEPVVLKPGVSKRIWLTFKTRGMNLKPGVYKSAIAVTSSGGGSASVPVELRIWPLRFPDQVALHSVSWGYFDDPNLVGREEAAARDLEEHYNTTLVINHRYLPKPKADEQGNLIERLDFSKIDQMIAWNPNCRMWLLWLEFRWGLGEMGTGQFNTPAWKKAFAQYVTQVRDHLAKKGIGREQFAWYWTDEPAADHWRNDIIASKTLKEIDPQMLVWANPSREVGVDQLTAALPYVDIYCPSGGTLATVSGVLGVAQQTHLKSWMYDSGSDRNADPEGYYRRFAWRAWNYKLAGIGMWVYVDEKAATFSDYTNGPSYAMIYGGEKGVIGSKRWDAWRQGIADYEYLRMLSEAADAARKAGYKGAALAKAEKILSEGVDRVVGNNPQAKDAPSAGITERYRAEILRCLSQLQGDAAP